MKKLLLLTALFFSCSIYAAGAESAKVAPQEKRLLTEFTEEDGKAFLEALKNPSICNIQKTLGPVFNSFKTSKGKPLKIDSDNARKLFLLSRGYNLKEHGQATASEELKTFCQENEKEHPYLKGHLTTLCSAEGYGRPLFPDLRS